MVGVLIRLKVATLRHAWRGSQASTLWTGAAVGLLLAAWTLSAVLGEPDVERAFDLLAVAFGLWAAGWLMLQVLGGSGGDPLRPEHFRLFAIAPRRLASGLLVAGAVGVLPLVTVLAFLALLVPAASLGPPAVAIAVIAVVVMLALVIALSRVIAGAMGRAMESRLGLEAAALQYALIVALSMAWLPIGIVGAQGGGGGIAITGWSIGDLARILPTGWGVVAVDAAGRADWPLAVGALAGQIVFVGLLAWAWSALVARRLQLSSGGRARTSGRTPALPFARLERAVVPATPFGGTVSRELRAWVRHPRRTLELRVAVWCAILLAVLPAVLGSTVLWPWAGAIVVVVAGVGLANVYGMDGTAFWLTVQAPGTERLDVRGRQAAWLLVVGIVGIAATVVLTAVSGHAEAWPWVAAVLPALLGGAAGLGIVLAVFAPAPLPERRGGDPLDLGDDPTTGGNLMLHGVAICLVVPLLAVPAVVPLVQGLPAGAAILVGVATGVAYAWLGGALAAWRLQRAGPETLERLRARPAARRTAKAATGGGRPSLSRSRSILRNLLLLAGALLVFPQGIVALVLRATGSVERLWFGALYLPEPWPVPAAIASIALGVAAWYAAWRLGRTPAGTARQAPQRSAQ